MPRPLFDLAFFSSLRFRVAAAAVTLIAIAAGAMGFTFLRQTERQLVEVHRLTGATLARNVARTIEIDVKARNTERIREQLALLDSEPFVRYATVLDECGSLLAVWFRDPADVPPSARSGTGRPPPEEARIRDFEARGEPISEITVAVLVEERPGRTASGEDPFAENPLEEAILAEEEPDARRRVPVGQVCLGLSRRPILDRIAEARAATARVVALTALLGAIASVLLVRRFLRPIGKLAEVTRAVGRGEFDRAIAEAPAEGEFATLAEALSHMTNDLKEMRRRLVEANESLEQKVAERTAELERALEELKVLDKMKDEFLSSVSHEFRTPLTSIRASAEILLEFAEEPPETRREFVEMILQETERLTRLVTDILDFIKIESGDLEWTIERVDVLELAESALRQLRPCLDEHTLRATIVRRDDVPPVHADRERIYQVLTNLLSNAIKFSHEGGSIEVTAEREGEFVKVAVRDEGVGIEPKDQQAIFDRFRQIGDTLTEKPSGTGLGLPICKNIVQRHGGQIWVESRLGKGATFYFTLPIEPPTDPAPPSADRHRDVQGNEGRTAPSRSNRDPVAEGA